MKECKKPGSVPPGVMKRVVRQVADHIEAENPSPSKKTLEWVAWTYCLKYPGLTTANPLDIFGGNVESNRPNLSGTNVPACKAICFTVIASKGVLAEKLRRELENKCYQNKHKSVEGDHFSIYG